MIASKSNVKHKRNIAKRKGTSEMLEGQSSECSLWKETKIQLPVATRLINMHVSNGNEFVCERCNVELRTRQKAGNIEKWKRENEPLAGIET